MIFQQQNILRSQWRPKKLAPQIESKAHPLVSYNATLPPHETLPFITVTQSNNILKKATCAYASYATWLALSKNSSTREDLKRVIPIQRFIWEGLVWQIDDAGTSWERNPSSFSRLFGSRPHLSPLPLQPAKNENKISYLVTVWNRSFAAKKLNTGNYCTMNI